MITVIANVAAASPNNANVTTAATPKDTTGAKMIVVATGLASSPLVPADNFGNIYTPHTSYAGAFDQVRLWQCENPICGPGHFWSMAGAPFVIPSIAVVVLAGTIDNAFDLENGAGAALPGSITPSQDDEIILTAVVCANGVPSGINSGFTLLDAVTSTSSTGLGFAYIIQGSAAAVNPMWSGTGIQASTIAAFKSDPSPPPPPPTPLTLNCASSVASQGDPYFSALVAGGGTAPYTYSISAGALPTGLTLNPSTGAITGTPTVLGVQAYTGKVTDSLGAIKTSSCSINVTTIFTGGCTIVVTGPSHGVSRPLNILTSKQFAVEREKGLPGMPIDVYLDQNYPNAGFHVWPVPNLAYIIEFYYWAVLQQFDDVTEELALPPAYYDALVFAIALALCPSYRRPVPPSIAALAVSSMKTVQELNAQILAGSFHEARTLVAPNEGEPKPAALGPPQPTLLPGAVDPGMPKQ